MLPIDFNGLDTAVHGPVRLGVLTALQIDGSLEFTTLKQRLGVADGVVGMHLRKLEEVGYLIGPVDWANEKHPKNTRVFRVF